MDRSDADVSESRLTTALYFAIFMVGLAVSAVWHWIRPEDEE